MIQTIDERNQRNHQTNRQHDASDYILNKLKQNEIKIDYAV